jgi:two-component system cell cycle sensor histidine kinase/response regulator CckA
MSAVGESSATGPDLQLQSLGRLAGGLAHDVNNLLLVIRSYVDSASSAVETGDLGTARDDLAGAAETVERAGRMTQGLLSAVNPHPASPVSYHLNAVLESMDSLLRDVVGSATELVLEPGADVPELEGTPALIEQVILNLVLNARDGIVGQGRVVIKTASLSAEDAPDDFPAGSYAILSVTDNGEGMDEKTRERVFDPFFTTKPGKPGRGLGLTTVREIAHRHGGDVRIRDAGPGTTVAVILPATAAKTAA